MSKLHRFFEPSLPDVLDWILAHKIAAGLMLVTMAVIFFVWNVVRKQVRPRLIAYELAGSRDSALHILVKWGATGKFWARCAILIDFLFLPALAVPIAYFCFWAAASMRPGVEVEHGRAVGVMREGFPWLAWLGVRLGWATLGALLSGWAENLIMLLTIARGRGTKSVLLTRLFACLKYGILSVAAAVLICRFEYYVYEKLEPLVDTRHGHMLAVLAAASALAGMWMLKLATPLHPSLLTLQLAPSSNAANRVLARWGAKRQLIARRANRVDSLFAILYTETLAFLFFGIAHRLHDWPILTSLTRSVGWYMLLAGTCHLAQNCGVEAALRDHKMGWWIQISRSCGALRFFLLFLGGLWAGFLVLLAEAHLLSSIQAIRNG